CSFLFSQVSRDHRDLHSFPTRRSSDLTAVAMPMFNSLAAFSKFMLLPSVIYYNYLFILVVTKVCFFSCLLPTIYRKRAFCRHLFEFRLEYLNNINNRLFFQIGSSQ